MILEAKRAISDWLQDTTYGLAAVLATLPMDGSDVAPSSDWVISDDTRGTVLSDCAALSQFRDDDTRVCYVRADDTQSLDGQSATYTHDADVPVVLTVGVRASSPSAAVRDLDYTLRAIAIVMESLFDPNNTVAQATSRRNSVQLKVITGLQSARTQEQLESNLATAHLRAVIACRDIIA